MVAFLIVDGILLIISISLFYLFRERSRKIAEKQKDNKDWDVDKNYGQWWKIHWHQIFAYLSFAIISIIIVAVIMFLNQ